jgi:hypothetical protein
VSVQESLFPASPEEQAAKLDAVILNLLMGHPGGPFNQALEPVERNVLRTIRFKRGIKQAISIRDIQQQVEVDARSIKQAVRTLRINFRLPIGSTKHATDGGYFLMLTAEDRAAWAKEVLDQVRAELGVLRAAAGDQVSLELLGQLRIEMEGGR